MRFLRGAIGIARDDLEREFDCRTQAGRRATYVFQHQLVFLKETLRLERLANHGHTVRQAELIVDLAGRHGNQTVASRFCGLDDMVLYPLADSYCGRFTSRWHC